ncbi:MAG: glycoside hydrolase family 5 protein [Oscillospiraceae bacterium]|nr:glycoside hydrolase family 5 protein [Oscillospiraceae bacterium]
MRIKTISLMLAILLLTACTPAENTSPGAEPEGEPTMNQLPTGEATPEQPAKPSYPRDVPDISHLTSMELVRSMTAGWNLGNTLDAHWRAAPWKNLQSPKDQETLWGNPVTTRAMIDFIRESGFDTVRIPVTWYIFTGSAPDYHIDERMLDRVQEIVDIVIDNGMFCILNIHHDDYLTGGSWENGWLRLYGDDEPLSLDEKAELRLRFTRLWEQISDRFQEYDEYLIFEGINEPMTSTLQKQTVETWAEQSAFLNELLQDFIDTVRAGGGVNPDRHLMVTPYYASVGMDVNDKEGRIAGFIDIEAGTLRVSDPRDRLIVSLHYYEPWGFVTAPSDSPYFSPVFDLSVSSVSWNLNQVLSIIETYFTKNGIPVIMGETGALHREMENGQSNEAERVKWAEMYVSGLKKLGVPVIIWDDGGAFELLDRQALAWVYPDLAAALVEAAK